MGRTYTGVPPGHGEAGCAHHMDGMVPELVLETTQVLLDITAKNAQELALQIRNIITQGMDDIWRERNTAQHHPNAREEINAKIQEAYEKKELLGLDQGPHREPPDITSLPFKMKQKWLENANQRIEKKEEDNARRAAAMKALQTGSTWAWNPAANIKNVDRAWSLEVVSTVSWRSGSSAISIAARPRMIQRATEACVAAMLQRTCKMMHNMHNLLVLW